MNNNSADSYSPRALRFFEAIQFIFGIALIIFGIITFPLGIVCFIGAALSFFLSSHYGKLATEKEHTVENVDNTTQDYYNQHLNIPYVKKYKIDKAEANRRIKQLADSYDIMGKTTNPETFFMRLHFSYDCILDLMSYKIKFVKGCEPEQQYLQLTKDMENMVDEMVQRCYSKETESAMKLKTDKAKINRMIKFFSNMETVFNNANKYWEGGTYLHSDYQPPHYQGPLYTKANLEKLQDLKLCVFRSFGYELDASDFN